MRLDSRLVLVAVLLLGGLAVVWTAWGDPETDTANRSGSQPDPEISSGRGSSAADPSPITPDPANAPPTTLASTTTVSPPTTTAFPIPEVLMEVHPPLVDIDGWLQSEVETLEELRGKVVVVEFWTFGCYNCKNRIPHSQELYARYRPEGLEMVGIHSPEFKYEEDVENIRSATEDLGVTWPVVLDTRRRTFWEWQTGGRAYWPRTYVLDRQGRVRFDHIGEGKYRELEQTVAFLLDEGA